MKVIPAYFEIQDDLDAQSLAIRIEACGRICYKSEDKIEAGSTEPFIEKILKHGHNSVAEMAVITLKVGFDSETLATQFFLSCSDQRCCITNLVDFDPPKR